VENSKAATAIIREDKLRSGQFSFTVTKKGTVENVLLIATSGYPSVDEALIDLVSNMPDKWIPATNSVGEKVDQEFVFVFGKQGC
jgi:outer membrane biosynthesis protein TonB